MPTDPRVPAAADSVVREADGKARRIARKRAGVAPRPPASDGDGAAAPCDGGDSTKAKPLYINSLF